MKSHQDGNTDETTRELIPEPGAIGDQGKLTRKYSIVSSGLKGYPNSYTRNPLSISSGRFRARTVPMPCDSATIATVEGLIF
jgi:hypothetical protein